MHLSPKTLLLLLLSFCTALELTGQAFEIEVPQEKIFAHLDKSIYRAGEPVFVALYLVNAISHAPDSISGVIHLELRGPEDKIVLAHKIYPNNGHAAGDFLLPVDLFPGNYQVVAYTRHQLNHGIQMIHRSPISIIGGLPEAGGQTTYASVPLSRRVAQQVAEEAAPKPAIRLGFFPEGGDCVVGLPCRVAVVAQDQDGIPLALEGSVGEPGQVAVGFFKTNEQGIGSLRYTPNSTTPLRASLKLKEAPQFDLPLTMEKGTIITVVNEADSVRIKLRSNLPEGLKGHSIKVQARSVEYFEYNINDRRPLLDFLLANDRLVPGVYVATVYNPNGEPVAERLFFSAPKVASDVLVVTGREAYPKRARIDLDFQLPNLNKAGEGRLSVSVIPSTVAALNKTDIRAWLLMNSDLDRPIPALNELLFAGRNRKREAVIDEILLTRGWRRFHRVFGKEGPETELSYPVESGLYVSGRMTKLDRPDAGRTGKIWLTRQENGYQISTLTDPEGYFQFGPFSVFDTLPILLQGRFRPGSRNFNDDITLKDKRLVSLKVEQSTPPKLSALAQPTPLAPDQEAVVDPLMAEYEEISRRALTVARQYDSLIIDLAVIDVISKRYDPVEESRDERAALYGTPDDRIVVDAESSALSARNVLDLLRNVAGVQVTTGGPEGGSVKIRGGNSSFVLSGDPLFIIDGFPADLEWAMNIPPEQIEFIDVLKGASASAYGSRGANGVILLYTREGNFDQAEINGNKPTKLFGYHTQRQFSDFFARPEDQNRPDIRTTLHWNPFLYSNAKGQAMETFWSSDQTGSYDVIVQGLGDDGRPYFGRGRFRVE